MSVGVYTLRRPDSLSRFRAFDLLKVKELLEMQQVQVAVQLVTKGSSRIDIEDISATFYRMECMEIP